MGLLNVAKPKASKGRGRPKASKPLKSIVSLKGTDELEVWLDGLTEHVDAGTKAHALRRALRALAESAAYPKPMPKR